MSEEEWKDIKGYERVVSSIQFRQSKKFKIQ